MKRLAGRSLPYQMMCSTVRLGMTYKGNEKSDPASATGFLFDFDGRPVIITNRHAIIDGDNFEKPVVMARVHYARIIDGERRLDEYTLDLENERIAWIKEEGIDLAAVSIEGLIAQLPNGIADLDHYVLSRDNLPTAEYVEAMDPMEEVFMVGYPAGKMDERNVLPFTRRGIMSVPYQLGFKDDESKDNGADSFLLDIECVKGSSGSPVFAADRERIILLGVNKQNRWQKGRIEGLHIENANVTYSHPIHLSVCTKSLRILELQEIFQHGGDDLSEVGRMATPDEVMSFFGVRS